MGGSATKAASPAPIGTTNPHPECPPQSSIHEVTSTWLRLKHRAPVREHCKTTRCKILTPRAFQATQNLYTIQHEVDVYTGGGVCTRKRGLDSKLHKICTLFSTRWMSIQEEGSVQGKGAWITNKGTTQPAHCSGAGRCNLAPQIRTHQTD